MGFLFGKSKDKLYKQWSEHSGLPAEAIPKKEVAKETPVKSERIERRFPEEEVAKETPVRAGGGEQRLRLLYILLLVAIVVLCVGVVILAMQGS